MLDDALLQQGFKEVFLSSLKIFEVSDAREFLKKRRQYKPLILKNQFTKGDAGTNPKLI